MKKNETNDKKVNETKLKKELDITLEEPTLEEPDTEFLLESGIEERKKEKKNIWPLAIYLIIFILLSDALALVLYINSTTYMLNKNNSENENNSGGIKVVEMPVDVAIKENGDKCNKTLVENIKNEANNVKFNYVPYTKIDEPLQTPDDDIASAIYNSFQIVIENVTPNLIVSVRDNLMPSNTYKFNYSDSIEGTITFEPKKVNELITYYVTISSANSECGEQIVKKVSVEAPMVNNMILYDMCYKMDHIKECNYFTWKQYNPNDVKKIIEESKKTTTSTNENNTENNAQNTTKKPENDEKSEKNGIKIDKTIKIIVLIGIIGVIIVAVGAFAIDKKRG